MLKTRLQYLLLSVFIASILFLIFLQFNANNSINDLIEGNRQLKNELLLKNSLQQLRSDLLSIESKIKGAVIANDTQHLIRIEQEIEQIRADITLIEKNSEAINAETLHLFTELKEQVYAKIKYSIGLIDTLDAKGKAAAEAILNQPGGNELTNKILTTIQQLDKSSEQDALAFSNKSDNESRKAFNWGLITVAVACIFGLVAFIFITGRIKRQEQLIKALDEAQKKERELAQIKEQFLANMSHEIRTPMNAVLGFTQLLQKQELNERSKEYVSAIASSGENLMQIINDILDSSKIEAGMMRIEKAPFSLRELIQSIQVMFEARLSGKNVNLTTSVEQLIPDYLIGDSLRLTQILVNLVSNAVKFTEAGSIQVNVTAQMSNGKELQLLLQVKDSGIGIASSKLATIFDRFVQADAASTRQYGGTGLGLAIVKQLALLQNGWVKAESEPGKGSCFTVMIPYEKASDELVTPLMNYHPTEATKIGEVKLLVAEDNEMNQNLLRHLFDNWQVNFTIVNNGKEALELLRTATYDLMFMDIQMPIMNGYTAAQLIRKELQSSVPIIAMTAHAMEGEKEKCLSYGMNDYISKPLREQELLNLIEHYGFKKNLTVSDTNVEIYYDNYKVIQLQYLRELSKGNQQFEKEMAQEFLIQVPQQLYDLKTAISKGDVKEAAAVAHNMKTTVSFMGLQQSAVPLLDNIESIAQDASSVSAIHSMVTDAEDICTSALEETRQFLQSFSK